MKQHQERVTRAIHWSVAALVIFLLALGFYMTNTESFGYYPLHKSLGVIALMAVIARLYWRIKHPWSSSMKGTGKEKTVKIAHTALIVLLVLMPITGMCLSGFGGYGVKLFGLELIASNYDEAGNAVPFNAFLADFGYAAHEIVGYVLSALIVLHVLAALKHHLIEKDNTLTRMLGVE